MSTTAGWTADALPGSDGTWTARILDRDGVARFERRFGSSEEAATFVSTVQQHAHWLSDTRFREYYRV